MNIVGFLGGLILLLLQISNAIREPICILQIANEFSHYNHSKFRWIPFPNGGEQDFFMFRKLKENDNLLYSCQDGFTMFGKGRVGCSESKWTSPPPRCYADIAPYSSLSQVHRDLVDGSADTGIRLDHMFSSNGYISINLYREYSLKAVKIITRSDLPGSPISITVRAGKLFWNHNALNTDNEHIIHTTDESSNSAAITGWNQLTSLNQLQLSIDIPGSEDTEYLSSFNANFSLTDVQIFIAPKFERCEIDPNSVPGASITTWSDSGQCYYHFSFRTTFLHAEELCQNLSMRLVYIKSDGVLLKTINHFRSHAKFGVEPFWISGFYNYSNREAVAYGRVCMVVFMWYLPPWKIQIVKCKRPASFICETEFSGCAAPPNNDNYQGQSSGWFPEGMSLGVGCMDGNNTQIKCLSGKWEPENFCQLISTQPNSTSDAEHEERAPENNAMVTALIGCNLAWILLLLYFIIYKKTNSYMLKQRKRFEELRSELQSRTGYTNDYMLQSRSKNGKRLYEYID